MKKHSENREVKIMGIDLAKKSLHVYGVDADGRKAISKKFGRQKLKEYLVNLPVCTLAMEACASAHYWARLLKSYGHEVKLIGSVALISDRQDRATSGRSQAAKE